MLFDKCEIVDYPCNSYRGVLIDIARGIKPFDTLKADLVTCAKAKYNVIQFHLNDNDGKKDQHITLGEGTLDLNLLKKIDTAIIELNNFDNILKSKEVIDNL